MYALATAESITPRHLTLTVLQACQYLLCPCTNRKNVKSAVTKSEFKNYILVKYSDVYSSSTAFYGKQLWRRRVCCQRMQAPLRDMYSSTNPKSMLYGDLSRVLALLHYFCCVLESISSMPNN